MKTWSPGRRFSRLAKRWREWGDEWWLDIVAEEFGFLERYGFRQSDVYLHFKGSAVTYEGPRGAVRVFYPEYDTGPLDVEYLREGMGAWYGRRSAQVSELIAGRGLMVGTYHRHPKTKAEARESFVTLARGLQALADELFGPADHHGAVP